MNAKNQSDALKIKTALEYSDRIISTLRESFLVLDKNLRIISANASFYATFEVAEKDTIGRPLPDLGDRQWNIPKLLALLKEIIPEKKVIKDYQVEHKFAQIGQRVMVLNACQLRVPKKMAAIIAAEAIREEEKEELILLAIEDITVRKKLEDELAKLSVGLEDKVREKTKELVLAQERIVKSEKLAVIGRLSSSIAHELRNPLAVIKNVLYYLNMLELGKDSPDIKESFEIISTEIDNSDKVINDLLEFSRIKQSTLNPAEINSIIQGSLIRIKVPANINVITELSEDLPQIEVDVLQMQQVFYNLISNALQAMEKGGILTVTSYLTQDEKIAIAFKDTGCGIPKANLARVLEPLFSTKMKGTGLGLTVVVSLVESNGGSLEIESQENKGSTFIVKIPIKKKGGG